MKFLFIIVLMLQFSFNSSAATDCAFIGKTSVKEILWTDMIGVEEQGESLVKTGPQGWNSAAFSTQYIGGDGAVEFTVKGAKSSRMVGLAYVNTDVRYEWIDYAVFLTSYGRLYIFENGVQRGNFTSYSDDDVIRIERKYDVVTYLKNGEQIYTSSVPSSGDLHVDVSMYSENATVDNTKIYGAGTVTEVVTWLDQVDTEIRADALEKTGDRGWQSGAASLQYMPGDGAVEFTVSDDNDTLVFGLSRRNENAGYKDIDYAIYVSSNGSFNVYEDGFNKGSFGAYHNKDIFRIERQGSRITYLRNCEPFYVSKKPSTGRLLLDVSLYSRGAKIANAVIYGAVTD
jgi:hypothetical protein